MVWPSALAETVTPPIFSPTVDVTVPLRMMSPARAGAGRVVSNAMRAIVETCARVIGVSPGIFRSALFSRRQRLQIGGNCVDLSRRKMMLEARHAWRAVCDHLAHEFGPAVERLARQHRSELAQHEVRLGMTDAAALLVKPPSEPLLVGQLTRIAALREYGWRGNAAKQKNGGSARHPWHSPKFIFLAKHRPALAETEGRGRTLCLRAMYGRRPRCKRRI